MSVNLPLINTPNLNICLSQSKSRTKLVQQGYLQQFSMKTHMKVSLQDYSQENATLDHYQKASNID